MGCGRDKSKYRRQPWGCNVARINLLGPEQGLCYQKRGSKSFLEFLKVLF